jgi:predicted nucleic acid-binding protein
MAMTKQSDSEHDVTQPAAVDARDHARDAFEYANASLALDGLAVDARQADRQAQVVNGKLSIADAIAQAIAEHRGGAQ